MVKNDQLIKLICLLCSHPSLLNRLEPLGCNFTASVGELLCRSEGPSVTSFKQRE